MPFRYVPKYRLTRIEIDTQDAIKIYEGMKRYHKKQKQIKFILKWYPSCFLVSIIIVAFFLWR